jgi:hypothetical protein
VVIPIAEHRQDQAEERELLLVQAEAVLAPGQRL